MNANNNSNTPFNFTAEEEAMFAKQKRKYERMHLGHLFNGPETTDNYPKEVTLNHSRLLSEWSKSIEPEQCVWELNEKCYYWYFPNNGLWVKQESEEVEHRLLNYVLNRAQEDDYSIGVTERSVKSLLKMLRIRRPISNVFVHNQYIHCHNAMVDIMTGESHSFASAYWSRAQLGIDYIPAAKCPMFMSFLSGMFHDPDDVTLIQRVVGQCLLGRNKTATVLIIHGPGGSGKSTLLNLIMVLLGINNCVLYSTKFQDKFEVTNYAGKLLLYNPDAPGNIMETQSDIIKTITGDEQLEGRVKGVQGGAKVSGKKCMIICTNSRLRIRLDGDDSAWARRLAILECQPRAANAEAMDGYEHYLLDREGSGVLNFFIAGARSMIEGGFTRMPLSKVQLRRVSDVLGNSQPTDTFVRTRVRWADGCGPGVSAAHPLHTINTGGPKIAAQVAAVRAARKDGPGGSVTCVELRLAFGTEYPDVRGAGISDELAAAVRKHFGLGIRHDISRDGRSSKSGWEGITLEPPTVQIPVVENDEGDEV